MELFTDKQSTVLRTFQAVSGVIEKHSTMPILSNVLIQKNGSNITLVGSDLEIQISHHAQLENVQEGDFSTTVSVRKIIDILKTISPEQSVNLQSESDRIILKSGRSKFTLQTLPSADFPLVQKAPEYSPKFTIKQKDLKALIKQVAFSMAVQDIRYYLNGMLFVAEGNTLSLVATDGHRLAYTSLLLDEGVPKQEVILPRKTVLELERLLSDKEGDIELQFASNQALFSFGQTVFISKLVEGKFPDYNRVIPKNQPNVLVLGRAPLLAMLQRIAIMTSEKFKGIRLSVEQGIIRVNSNNLEKEEAVDELEIDYAGEKIEIGFNVTYLIEVLSNMNQEMVRIELADGNSSALFTIPENENFKYVVMPLKI